MAHWVTFDLELWGEGAVFSTSTTLFWSSYVFGLLHSEMIWSSPRTTESNNDSYHLCFGENEAEKARVCERVCECVSYMFFYEADKQVGRGSHS